MVKPNTSLGKLSWRPTGASGAGSWKPLGTPDSVPFLAPDRKIDETNTIGSTVARQKFVQQKPRDVTINVRATTFAFIGYCMQSDPAVDERHTVGFVYKAQNVGKTIELAYTDTTIQYTATSVAVKKVKLTASDGQITRMEITFSISKITIGEPGDVAQMVDFDSTNEIGIEDCFIGIGASGSEVELESPSVSFTIEPNVEHGNIIGADYDESVNFGNVKYILDVEGYYDSTLHEIAAAFSPVPAIRYLARFGLTGGSHYLTVAMETPIEKSAEFDLTGDNAVKLSKTLEAMSAPEMLFKDATYAAARYWT